MARGRASSYDDQRINILAQAARLFARQGYAATSMNQVADACGLSKAALYHYFRDKYALLTHIAETHVQLLLAVTLEVETAYPQPQQRLQALIERFVREYSGAQDAHHVLTGEVRFLDVPDRDRILGIEREVVVHFAQAISEVRPELRASALDKPLSMLLFGMINWLFTWFKPSQPLDYSTLAPLVADAFLNGMRGLHVPNNSLMTEP